MFIIDFFGKPVVIDAKVTKGSSDTVVQYGICRHIFIWWAKFLWKQNLYILLDNAETAGTLVRFCMSKVQRAFHQQQKETLWMLPKGRCKCEKRKSPAWWLTNRGPRKHQVRILHRMAEHDARYLYIYLQYDSDWRKPFYFQLFLLQCQPWSRLLLGYL